MSDTADKIIDVMELLIETRGYNAVSYQDIADRVGIRKASIHHHFPSKTILGAAVIARYSKNMWAIMDKARQTGNAWDALEAYFIPYKLFSDDGERICLCGALAGEFCALPPEMRELVSKFFDDHQHWLEELIIFGVEKNEFTNGLTPRQKARQIFTALQGALIVRRAIGDNTEMADVMTAIRGSLKASG